MATEIPQPNARCPRCGYDLRGTIETWKHECPINGICTECGLEFEWGELLCNRRNMPRWCVEYGRWWSIPITAVKTVLVLFFRPRKFWHDLKMVHKPRAGRILALALPVLLLLYLAFALSVGHRTYKQFKKLNQDYISTPFHPEAYGIYAIINPFSNYQFTYTRTTVLTTLTQTTTSPRRYANWIAKNLRPSLFWKEVSQQIRNPQFTPFRGRMRMSVVIVQGLMLVALCPLAFMVLPQSLRKAKVRWQHLARVALYSSLIIVPPLGLYMRNGNGGWNFHWWLPQWLVPCSLIYMLTGLIIWWSLAAKHYLKLPHAWGVGVSMVVLAYAGGLLIVSLIDFVMI